MLRMRTRQQALRRSGRLGIRLAFLVRWAPRITTAGSQSVGASRAPGCRISPVTRSPIRRCRLLARFCPRKPCCRSGLSRNPAPTIRARCTAVCPRGPACACWPRAAGADDYGPRSRRPRARELEGDTRAPLKQLELAFLRFAAPPHTFRTNVASSACLLGERAQDCTIATPGNEPLAPANCSRR